MIYRVRHTTRYDYSGAVDLAAHMLHLRPRPMLGQSTEEERLLLTPQPAWRRDGLDHFGNHVTWLLFDWPHGAFEVTSDALVTVDTPAPPEAAATPPWEAVAAAARRGGPGAWEAAEFRFESPMVPVLDAAGVYAAPSFPPGRPVLEGLVELNGRICRDFTFRAGVTSLSTTVAQVLERREGVCQDFTHLMVSALRALGLPARYTSGYIRTRPPPGKERRRGADVSHAWVGAWLGPEHGWIGLDPTNDLVVGDEHVVLAWGRDYSDISPVRGLLLGGGAHTLRVGVDLESAEEG